MAIQRICIVAVVIGMATVSVSGQESPRPAQSQVSPPRTSSAEPQEIPEPEPDRSAERAAERRAERAVQAARQAESRRTDDSQSDDETGDETRVQSQQSVQTQASARTYLRARDLIGLSVRGDGDAELGTVYDVFIDPRTFGVQYVVLDTGTGANAGGQLPILPWALFQTSAGGSLNQGYLTVPLSVERLEVAPMIGVSDPDLVDSAAWVTEVDEYYDADLREVRVSRPDFDENPNETVNDRDSLPIGRRPLTPGTPTGDENNSDRSTTTDRSTQTDANRQGVRSQRDRLTPQNIEGQEAERTPRGNANVRERLNTPGGNNPPGNTPERRNLPGGRNPPGNADRIDNAPGGRNPPGNAPATQQAPGAGNTPGAGNAPGSSNPPGNAPASGSNSGAGNAPASGSGAGNPGS